MARRGDRTRRLIALRSALAVVAVGGGLVAWLAPAAPGAEAHGLPHGVASRTTEERSRSADGSLPAAGVPAVVLDAAAAPDRSAPVAVRVPAVGVAGRIDPVVLDSSGSLAPPEDTGRAGWFAQGPAPGEVGPAVLAGHVDSWRGPGVFYRLAEAAAGQEVLVTRADGSTVRFTVTRVARFPKWAFPTAEVYGPTPDPELRLITCGGAFDRSARSYVDNIVVYARLA